MIAISLGGLLHYVTYTYTHLTLPSFFLLMLMQWDIFYMHITYLFFVLHLYRMMDLN